VFPGPFPTHWAPRPSDDLPLEHYASRLPGTASPSVVPAPWARRGTWSTAQCPTTLDGLRVVHRTPLRAVRATACRFCPRLGPSTTEPCRSWLTDVIEAPYHILEYLGTLSSRCS